MYQALYRKYRPRYFGDVTGQEHITSTLCRQVASGRLSHAYLFVGTRGTGKTTCAKILARAVNCLNHEDGEPCNKCSSCKGIESGSILDVLELEAASNNRVDDIRALLDEAVYSPASVKKRVYIVDEVHMLSTTAFNALLQILEEPPEHLLFILATTELNKVPSTILSRCQRFSFRRLSPATIASRLSYVADKESISLSLEAKEKLAALADGSMRDGLSLLDQCATDSDIDLQRVLDTIGLAGQAELLQLAEAVANRGTVAALLILDQLYDDGKDITALLRELASLYRDLLIFELAPDSPLLSSSYSRSELSSFSKMKSERLFSGLEVLREASLGIVHGGSVRLAAEMCLIRLCDERLLDDTSALLARIVRLESSDRVPGAAYIEHATTEVASNTTSVPKVHSQTDTKATSVAKTEEPEWPEPETAAEIHEKPEEINAPEVNTEPVAKAKPTDIADPETSAEPSTIDVSEEHTEASIGTTTQTVSNAANDYWAKILDILKDEVAVYALLSDSSDITAELIDNALIIRAGNPFAVQQIESKMFFDLIKDAACNVLGREILLRVESFEGVVTQSKHDKLEKLVDTFGIVNFE
ncbi:MAG: DNA polymerase III subunit gamma/tau [Oscillospiraceae bacterium]|nr:DNA polymerase III subunit gamma/tau [Oscillospiraceae bacterium]